MCDFDFFQNVLQNFIYPLKLFKKNSLFIGENIAKILVKNASF